MHYIGTDIIEIERIRQTIDRWGERFLNRVYTPSEQKMYDRRAHSLAACFAGKEAVMKVLGTGARGVAWREIETLHYRIVRLKRVQFGSVRLGALPRGGYRPLSPREKSAMFNAGHKVRYHPSIRNRPTVDNGFMPYYN